MISVLFHDMHSLTELTNKNRIKLLSSWKFLSIIFAPRKSLTIFFVVNFLFEFLVILKNFQVGNQPIYLNQSTILYQYAFETIHYISQLESQTSESSQLNHLEDDNLAEINLTSRFSFGNGSEVSSNDREGELDIFQFARGKKQSVLT